MLAMSKIVPESRDYGQIFDDYKHIGSLLEEIAGILGPHCFIIATIFGPFFDHDCKHIRPQVLLCKHIWSAS